MPQDAHLFHDTIRANLLYARPSATEKELIEAPSVVVLDEATAHLDSESEVAIQRALATALSGRTSLVIATGCLRSGRRTRSSLSTAGRSPNAGRMTSCSPRAGRTRGCTGHSSRPR